jgi:alpha-glucosidase
MNPPMYLSLHLSRFRISADPRSPVCNLPCDDPFQQAIEQSMPPPHTNPPPDPNTPIFGDSVSKLAKREDHLTPPYAINNAAGALSSKTAFVRKIFTLPNLQTNRFISRRTSNTLMGCWSTIPNIFGTMMSVATCEALLARRPGRRTFVITRSTSVGAGAHVGKWLGDNLSVWDHYRFSIADLRRSIKFRW